jgi:transcription antitermination protein NusB
VPDPKIRRRGRERALQFLYGLSFTGYAWQEAADAFWAQNPSRPGVRRYATQLIRGVCEHQAELDAEISEALANWSLARVGAIERNVMRIALYEMRHEDDVPPRVAINEALEVVKVYGADNAPRFVNGVLDRLAKKLRAEAPQ